MYSSKRVKNVPIFGSERRISVNEIQQNQVPARAHYSTVDLFFLLLCCFEIGEICIINTYYNRSAVLKYIVLLLYEEEEGRLPRKNKNKKNNKIPVLLYYLLLAILTS